MPVINFDLPDAETAKLDIIAKRQMRARKYAVSVLVMERIAEIEKQHPFTDAELAEQAAKQPTTSEQL